MATLAAGCSTSSILSIAAPSLLIVTSPISSTSIWNIQSTAEMSSQITELLTQIHKQKPKPTLKIYFKKYSKGMSQTPMLLLPKKITD